MIKVSPDDIEEACDWLKEAHQSERPMNSAESTPAHNPPSSTVVAEAIAQASAMENVSLHNQKQNACNIIFNDRRLIPLFFLLLVHRLFILTLN